MKTVLNRESISYIIFGVLTTLVDWASYALFWSLGWDYKVSTALSWAAAVLFAFVTNKFWVFRSFTLKLSYLWKEFVSFVACRAATGVLTMLGMILMVDGFHWNEFLGKLMVSAIDVYKRQVWWRCWRNIPRGCGGEPIWDCLLGLEQIYSPRMRG